PGTQGLVDFIAAGATRAAKAAGPLPFAPLAARLTRPRVRPGARGLILAFAACGALAAVVALADWPHLRALDSASNDVLTYTVNGRTPSPAGALSGSDGAPILSFSDGTRVALGPQARGRVVEISRHGARVALDEGRARVEVAHRPGAQWLFEAGPFLIKVHGTAFTFGWNALDARLDLTMDSGIVSVTGPLSGGEIFLRAGQTFSVSLNDRGTAKSAAPASVSVPAPALTPRATPPTDAPAGAAPVVSPRPIGRAAPAASWATELADGRAAAVVADAERRGLGKVLDDSSSEDLAALADASRFERNDRLARRALLAQRRRFPHSARAGEASFLLGRLDEPSGDGAGAPELTSAAGARRALEWYDRYLQESPQGAYVSEALGRKMMVLERTHRQTEATAIAADYLRRFPAGTYSHAARALVRAP
ncbi:MAG TPA: FecR domain-containing protein, partial [Polyangia bacterium]|nr:FecR domain-containing protein [Polyangia bacterium]